MPKGLTKVRKEDVLAVMSEISGKQGIITSRGVLEAARSLSSPIHDYFDWDDGTAAEKHRLWQARQLVRTVIVEYKGRMTAKFWNAQVTIDDEVQQGYFSIEEVMDDDAIYNVVLFDAVKELKYWQHKYNTLKEVKELVDSKRLAEVEVETLRVKEAVR